MTLLRWYEDTDNPENSYWDWWDSTTTDASGHYTLNVDDADVYTIRAKKPGYAAAYLGSVSAQQDAETFVGGDPLSDITLNVIQFATVSGKVTAMGRGAYAEAQVLRWNQADGVWETWWGEDDGIDSYVETAADGSYQFKLPVGATYTVRVDGVYLGGSTTEPASPTAGNSVTVSSTAARTLPTIVLAGPVFAGRVTADWMKLKNVVVTAYKWLPAQFDNPAGWYPQNSASTRADGTYQLRVPAGEYVLSFYSDNLGGERFENSSTKVPTTITAPNRRLVGSSSWATVNFDFAKALTTKSVLTAKAKAGKKKGTATLTVGLVLPGVAKSATTATVTVKDGKKTLKRTIKVKNGQGTLKLGKLKKGTHTFKVSYAGGRGYFASTATAKVRVK